MLKLRFLPGANQDFDESIAFYSGQEPGLERHFAADVEHALERILKSPLSHREIRHGIRRIRLKRFPFSIIYRVSGDYLDVLAIMHGARRPGYWRKRL